MTSTTAAARPLTAPGPLEGRGRIAQLVRAAARLSARHPKKIVALWLLLVVGCVASGLIVGTRSLTATQSEVGQSAAADRLLARSGLATPAVESILVSSTGEATTEAASASLVARLGGLAPVASVVGPASSRSLSTDGGRVALVQVTLRGSPDLPAPTDVRVSGRRRWRQRYHEDVTVVDRFAPRTTVAGGLLTSARVRAGLSQRGLAARAGVAQSTIARIESGHADPAFSTLERLLAAAGLEMRIRLEQADDHDAVLAAIDLLRSPEERERVAAGHGRNVDRFAEGGRRAGMQD